jgi:iron complex outermembrane receptor protein
MSHAAELPLPAGTVNAVAIQGGRTDGALRPERAKTLSFGVDLLPSGIQGLNLSLTYYKLKYENQIVSASDSNSLNNAAYANALAAAGLITFNPTTAQVLSYLGYGGFPFVAVVGPQNVYGTASGPSAGRTIPVAVLFDLRSVNTGLVETDGLDFTLRYSWQTKWGRWRIADSSTYVSGFKQSLLTGTPSTEYVNTYGFPVRFRSRAQLGFEKGGANINMFVDYVNSYANTQISPRVSVASTTIVDLNLGYSFGERKQADGLGRFSVQLNTQNLFNRKPPYALVGSPAQTYDSQNASVIGRLVTLSVEARL